MYTKLLVYTLFLYLIDKFLQLLVVVVVVVLALAGWGK